MKWIFLSVMLVVYFFLGLPLLYMLWYTTPEFNYYYTSMDVGMTLLMVVPPLMMYVIARDF